MTLHFLSDIDLSRPDLPEETFIRRSWKEEIIYFLMVDRFHDGKSTTVSPGSAGKSYRKEELMSRQGGTFAGIRMQLPYLKNLGCTTLWLSPVFENYESTYHGYAINNFLNTDPHFGTKEELRELVKEAHAMGIRIVLDVILNHTADTWYYQVEDPSYSGVVHPFGGWRNEQYPVPGEFRNMDFYKKTGAIQNWDAYPETQEGDIFELKKLVTDQSPVGKQVLEALVKVYSYWIKELGIDGFRLDTVKHLTPEAVAFFCSRIREYARYLGNDSFMIFGEAVGNYSLMSKYLRPVRTPEGFLNGLDAALDFPLHFLLEDVVKGERPVSDLYKLYRKNQKTLTKLRKSTSDLIVFADNHDQIGQEYKKRIAYEAEPSQVLATIGLLYFLYGIPCLYYGTEQFLKGHGLHDCFVREPMFEKEKEICFHDEKNSLFKEIAALASLRQKMTLFQEAVVEFDQVSVNGGEFMSCEHQKEVLYWSKRVFEEKMILLYNPQNGQNMQISAKLSSNQGRIKTKFNYVYGGSGEIITEQREGCGYINIDLNPLQFVILK